MSTRTQRCIGSFCGGRVMGKTSFRILDGGGRADVCRFCESHERARLKPPRSRKRQLSPYEKLTRKEASLLMRLAHVRRRILALEIEMERSA